MTGLMLATHWGARGILILMVGLSIWSVAIMIDRYQVLKKISKEKSHSMANDLIRAKDWAGLKKWIDANSGIYSGTLNTLLDLSNETPEKIEKGVRSFLTQERVKLETGFTTLATLAANAAFIGLLGTVLGIIQAFGALGQAGNNATSVMTGISEALVATAVGLFVAIPAGIAYNAFSRKLKLILTECESLKDLYLSKK